MNSAYYRFSLSMQSIQSQVSLPVLLNDTARRLLIKLVDNGKPYYINDGCRAVFYAEKADGNILINDCIIEKNAKIRYDFTAQTASAEGISKCEIRLYGTNGRLITSPKFIMVVDSRVVYDDQVVASYSEFTTLDAIIVTEQERVEAEAVRAEAEAERAKRIDEAIAKMGNATQVQANWAQTDTTAADYIKNKPAIPMGEESLPDIATDDNGKFLRVVNGVAAWATVDNAEGASF